MSERQDNDERQDNGELRHLFTIYARIDQLVRDDPSFAREIAPLLPVYRDADPSVHWYDDFARQTRVIVKERGGDPEREFDTLELAVASLAPLPSRLSMRARRLFAVAVAARARPQVRRVELVGAALGPVIGTRDEDDEGVIAFVSALRGDDILVGAEGVAGATTEEDAFDIDVWWQHVVQTAIDQNLIQDASQLGPRPCSSGLTWVDLAGNLEPAVTLKTELITPLSFEEVGKFLDPHEWECFPFWCHMDRTGGVRGGVQRYHEVVSFDCDRKEDSWTVEVDLDFTFYEATSLDEHGFRPFPRLAIAEYRLSQPQQQQRVLVNEGSLVISQPTEGSPVTVTTTKRLKFNGTFDGPAFATVMCLLGYLSYVEDLVCCAAKDAAGGDEPDHFPGRIPPASSVRRSQRWGAADDFKGLTGATIARIADGVEKCIDDWANVGRGSCEKGGSKPRTGGTLVDYATGGSVRMLSEPFRVAELDLRSARIGRSRPRPSRPGAQAPGSSAAGATTTPIAEVVEDYAELGKLLVRRWRDYGTRVAARLDAGKYDADTVVGDWASAVWLAVESGARLGWEAADAVAILRGGLKGTSNVIESDVFTIDWSGANLTGWPGATLTITEEFESGFRYKLPVHAIWVVPPHLGPNEATFMLCAVDKGLRAGTYTGKVVASLPTGAHLEVNARITIP